MIITKFDQECRLAAHECRLPMGAEESASAPSLLVVHRNPVHEAGGNSCRKSWAKSPNPCGTSRSRTFGKKHPSMSNTDIPSTTIEVWRPIPSYEGFYEASNRGRIRSLDRWIDHFDGGRRRRFWRGRLLKQDTSQVYPRVGLYKCGVAKTWLVHRLILLTFSGQCPDGMVCCHADDDPLNNCLRNLRWDTPTANNFDAVRNGRHWNASKVACIRGHEFNAANTMIRGSTGSRRCRECQKLWHRRRAQDVR